MRNKGFQKTLELVKQYILYGEAKCLKLLKVVENNQRYNFRKSVKIYDKTLKFQLVPSLTMGKKDLAERLCEGKRYSDFRR